MYTKDISILLYIYLHTDRLGSGSAVTDGRGEAVHVLGYMPYGETLLDLSHTHYETPYQFTVYEKDQETGLHYAEARYYDSWLSIFNSTDPMWYKYPSLSPYAYCGNNPIMITDKTGMKWNPESEKFGDALINDLNTIRDNIENAMIKAKGNKLNRLQQQFDNIQASITELEQMRDDNDQTFSFAISNRDGEGEGGLTIKRPDGVIEMQIPTGGTNIQPTDYVVYPEVAKYMFSMGVHEGKHGYDLWQKGAVRNEDDFFNREVSAYSRQYSYDQKSMPSSFYGKIKNFKDINTTWVKGIFRGSGSGVNYVYKGFLNYYDNTVYKKRFLRLLK